MQIRTIEFDDLRYNPEACAFEALVTVEDDGQAFRYPIHVPAPVTAEFRLIARRFNEKARQMHRQRGHSMHSQRPLTESGDIPLHALAA